MWIAAMALPLTFGLGIQARAATITWAGTSNNVFNNPANWPSSTLPSLTADVWQVNGPGTQGSTTLTLSSPLAFGATAAKISFGTSSANMTLSGSSITLFQGTGDGILTAVNSPNTTTIGSDIILGTGSAATNSISSTGTGILKVTGNITAGTGGTAGAAVLSLGSTGTQNGNYELAGNINKGSTATSLQLTKRGTGTATLTGTNVLVNLGNNEANSTIRINGGQTNILNAASSGFGIANQPASTIRVSAGELNSFDSRTVRNSILVDGGTWNLGQAYNESAVLQSNTSGARLSFNAGTGAPNYSFTLSSGNVNYLPSYTTGSTNFGIRLGNDSGAGNVGGTPATEPTVSASQTGGTFIVNGAGGQDTTFSLGTGTADKVNSYSLSGGTLDLRGSTGSNAFLTIGAASTGTTSLSTFTLSGSGKLLVRSQTAAGTAGGASDSGIQGRNSGGAQVLALTGGTLIAGRIDATNLRATAGGSNGLLVNSGSLIAPGDSNRTGLTRVVGDMQISSGTLEVDINGAVQSTIWQSAVNATNHDALLVTGNLTLGGDLNIRLLNAYDPTGLSFTIAQANTAGGSGSLSGAFANVAFGSRLNVVGGQGSFLVSKSGNDVVLSNFQPIPEPVSLLSAVAAGGLVLRRRKLSV
jgi:hypothetical protein